MRFLHEKKSTSRMFTGSPAFHWAGWICRGASAAPCLKTLSSGKESEGISFLSGKAFSDGCCCQHCNAELVRDSGFLVMLGHGWDYELFYFMLFAQRGGPRMQSDSRILEGCKKGC